MKTVATALCALLLSMHVGGLNAQTTSLAGVVTFPSKVLQHADNPQIWDQFGKAVATWGDDVVVSAPGDDTAATNDGSVYVYTHGGGAWPQTAKLTASDGVLDDQFGVAVDIHNDTIVVGAFAVGSGNWGAAYVYERVGGVWSQKQKLQVGGLPVNARLGYKVAVYGDYIALGAIGAGAVYIFQRNALGGGLWGLVAVVPSPFAPPPPAIASFGQDISLSGDLLLVGSVGNAAAYVFDRAVNWAHVGTLAVPGVGPTTAFAKGVSISGDTAVVGAAGVDLPPAIHPQTNQGAAYVFQRNQGGAGAWGLVQTLVASNYSGQDQFGVDVGIEGDLVVVGAFADDPFGFDSGSAYAYQRNAGGPNVWGETHKLYPDVGGPQHWFGRAVAASPVRALVGAPMFANNSNPSRLPGFAYVFDGLAAVQSTAPGYVLDGLGGVHAGGGATLPGPESPYYGFDIAVDLELAPTGYYVLDGFGGVGSGGGAASISGPATPYFGFDAAMDLELASTGYYVLDEFGAVYPGGGAPPIAQPTPYFGFPIAVDMELAPGGGFYVMDGFGGLHAGNGAPPIAGAMPYFQWAAAVDMELFGAGYYVLDAFGFIHSGGGAPAVITPYFGFHVAVDLEIAPVGVYVLDGWGGVHAGGGAPAMNPKMPYWAWHIARDLEMQ